MATFDDVRAIASGLPEAIEGEHGHDHWPGWSVRGKAFVFERQLRPKDIADLERLEERVPSGEVIAVRVPKEEKEAVLATVSGAFDIPHFNGYPAVLVELDAIPVEELRELITDAWIMQAPKRLAKAFLDGA